MRAFTFPFVSIAVALMLQPSLLGQEVRGTLLGRVTDQTEGAIVGASVHALNPATGVRSTTTTNTSGDYMFPFVIPGTYELTVEAPGFKTYKRPGISIRVNDRVTVDVSLEIGSTSESIHVTAESPILDTSTASMGQVIDSRTVLDLPLKDGWFSTKAKWMSASSMTNTISLATASWYSGIGTPPTLCTATKPM